jgi:hypothetical protein
MNKKEPVVLNSEVEMSKMLQIRNSTIDFLVFTKQNSQDSIEVRVQDENVWLTQDGISRLFDVDRSVVTKHLKNVFETNELEEISVCAKFAHTAADGKTYNTKFYNLDAIISVGYRVNSIRATLCASEFRLAESRRLQQYLRLSILDWRTWHRPFRALLFLLFHEVRIRKSHTCSL